MGGVEVAGKDGREYFFNYSMMSKKENVGIDSCYRPDKISLFYDGSKIDLDVMEQPKGGRRKVPRLVRGTIDDVRLSKKIWWKSRLEVPGLEQFVRIDRKEGAATYVVDRHQHALFAWAEGIANGLIKSKKATLLRFDMHDDMRYDPNELKNDAKDEVSILRGLHLDSVRDLISSGSLHEGNFVSYAIAAGMFREVINVEPVKGIASFRTVNDLGMPCLGIEKITPDYIARLASDGGLMVDLDRDFFDPYSTPAYDAVEQSSLVTKRRRSLSDLLERDMSVVRHAIEMSKLATVATTPSHMWMNPKRADFCWQVLRNVLK